ncbi:MAG: T9SS type A sorting domain-containing protein [Flavobacteriales bacterium]|jgi:hypothetical protein
MKKLFTLFILCLLAFVSQAQTYVGDITLSTQEEVDNFSTNYPGITYVEGNLIVTSVELGGITDLSGLNQLTGAEHLELSSIAGFNGWSPTNIDSLVIYSADAGYIEPENFALEEFTSQIQALDYLEIFVIQNSFNFPAPTDLTLFENLTSVSSMEVQCLIPTTFPSLQTIGSLNFLSYQSAEVHMPNVISLNTLTTDGWFESAPIATPTFTLLQHINYVNIRFTSVEPSGLSGLSSLTSIVIFESDDSMFMDYVGLSNVITAESIEIEGLGTSGEPILGFESLEYAGILSIVSSEFNDLQGFSNLQEVDSLIIFSVNGNSLEGIENLVINDYLVLSATGLSFCSVPSICNFISSNTIEAYFIDPANEFGCASDNEILASCGDPANSTIFGSIYFDSNCNGLIDDNEFTISPSYITVTPPNTTLIGLSSFLTNVAPQTTITLSAANLPSQYVVGTPISITTPEFGGTINNQNILVCPAFDFNDLRISILQFGNLGPGFTSLWKLQVYNLGTSTIDFIPSITFNTPEFIASVNALGGAFMNDMISWTANSISPGQTLEFDFNITLLPTANILGEMFSATASVDLVSGTDENPNDNIALFEQEIIGSYDPNDKWVNTPQINIEEIDPSQPLDLTYRVRFQNTGTAPAVNVRVEDILEEDLDPSTFQLLSSTHEVYYQIEGNQINFFFNDIMLPDSTSDPEGSIGTFFFRIKSNGNHTLESIIDNQVSIFFDFNEPIITNVASTIFYNCPVVDIIGESVSLCAGEELQLSAVASNNTTIQWFVNEEQVSLSDSYSFTSDIPNEYSVLVIAENEYCEDGDEIEITVNENPEVTLVFDGSALVATEGFASFLWTLNGNIVEGENSNTISSPAVGNYVVSVTNEFGCTDQSDVVEVVIGVNELNNSPIVLWPNPANDVLNIQTAYSGIINIIDMQGKQVMSFTLNGQSSVDISPLSSGLYQITGPFGLLGQFIKQ